MLDISLYHLVAFNTCQKRCCTLWQDARNKLGMCKTLVRCDLISFLFFFFLFLFSRIFFFIIIASYLFTYKTPWCTCMVWFSTCWLTFWRSIHLDLFMIHLMVSCTNEVSNFVLLNCDWFEVSVTGQTVQSSLKKEDKKLNKRFDQDESSQYRMRM